MNPSKILTPLDLQLFLIKEPQMKFLFVGRNTLIKLATDNNYFYREGMTLSELCDYQYAEIFAKKRRNNKRTLSRGITKKYRNIRR